MSSPRWFRRSASIVAVVMFAVPSIARAIVNPVSPDNTSAPADDPGWGNVGIVNRATGVYLGNRWVLTAAHVGAGDLTFADGTTYAADLSTVYRVPNPTGLDLSATTDMVLYQLTNDPGLSPVLLSESTPAIGSEVVVIGNGRDWDSELTHWRVSKGSSRWTWIQVAQPSDYAGYETVAGSASRWGTNLIEDNHLVDDAQSHFEQNGVEHLARIETSGDVVVFLTEFDGPNRNTDKSVLTASGSAETPFESQAVVNDSGGALFYKNGDRWELAGMTVAVDGFKDQPDPVWNAIFGDLTYYADLSFYRDQLTSRFVMGDFDEDGLLTVEDIERLTQQVLAGTHDPVFDLNGDRLVDQKDRAFWVEELKQTYFGDANLDGKFDSADLIVVLKSSQYEDAIVANSDWQTGDWNGDLEFTSSDLVAALKSGGYEQGPRSETRNVAVVPEPGASLLAVLGLLIIPGFARYSARRITQASNSFDARAPRSP